MFNVQDTPMLLDTTTVIAASSSQRIAVAGGGAVRLSVGAQGLWYKLGSSTVDATAGTASEGFVPANTVVDVPVASSITHVAIIQNAATAIGSVQVFK